jgi:cytoskeletal protein CcmA (bactofilin family)
MSLFSGRGGKRKGDSKGPSPASGRKSPFRASDSTEPAQPPAEQQATAPKTPKTPKRQSDSGLRGSLPQEGVDVASIGKSVVFRGDLSGEEDLIVDGQIEGQIRLPNHQLTIGPHSRARAGIEAKAVVIVGHVLGNITATERCEVHATGVVDGDIRAPRLMIQEGAVVNGNIDMSQQHISQAAQRGAAGTAAVSRPSMSASRAAAPAPSATASPGAGGQPPNPSKSAASSKPVARPTPSTPSTGNGANGAATGDEPKKPASQSARQSA